MRVLYLGMRWNYGRQAEGESFEHSQFHAGFQAWPRASALRHFDFVERGRAVGIPAMSKELVASARAFKPDLCFAVFFDRQHDPTFEAMQAIRELCPVLGWFCDSSYRYESFDRLWAPHLSACVTTSQRALEWYRRDGFRVIRSQWFASPAYFLRFAPGCQHDVCFIGQPHGDRRAVIQALRAAGLNVRCAGRGWPEGRVAFSEMCELFCRSRINLNLSNDCHGGAGQIKGRVFEVPACGGFLLTQDAENLRDYYEPEKEIGLFTDARDLVEKCRYWLAHEDERAAATRAAYERTWREHTFAHRMDAITAELALEIRVSYRYSAMPKEFGP